MKTGDVGATYGRHRGSHGCARGALINRIGACQTARTPESVCPSSERPALLMAAGLLPGLTGNGAPERIRTSDPQIRSLVLYPAELRVRVGAALIGAADGPRNPLFQETAARPSGIQRAWLRTGSTVAASAGSASSTRCRTIPFGVPNLTTSTPAGTGWPDRASTTRIG